MVNKQLNIQNFIILYKKLNFLFLNSLDKQKSVIYSILATWPSTEC